MPSAPSRVAEPAGMTLPPGPVGAAHKAKVSHPLPATMTATAATAMPCAPSLTRIRPRARRPSRASRSGVRMLGKSRSARSNSSPKSRAKFRVIVLSAVEPPRDSVFIEPPP